jgi:hypothetical protein
MTPKKPGRTDFVQVTSPVLTYTSIQFGVDQDGNLPYISSKKRQFRALKKSLVPAQAGREVSLSGSLCPLGLGFAEV